MSDVLKRTIRELVANARISTDDARNALSAIMAGEASPAQIGAFLVALKTAYPVPSPEILATCADVMVQYARPCTLPPALANRAVDIVGTGGDGMDTFNVSTAAGFVVAACGFPVAKHGNRSSSGAVGSADFLEALGCNIQIDGDQVAQCIEQTGFGFLFAQMFHPAMKNVAAPRKEIGVRTVFNLLGPLTNPARPVYHAIGVGSPDLGPLFASHFLAQGAARAIIVHSTDGLDEISPSAPSQAWIVENGAIREELIEPTSFGLQAGPLQDVIGGTAAERACAFHQVIGKERAQNTLRTYIILNAAAAIWVTGQTDTFADAAKLCSDVIDSGKVAEVVAKYVEATQSVVSRAHSAVAENQTIAKGPSILDTIAAQRRLDVAAVREALPLSELQERLKNPRFACINFRQRLQRDNGVAVIGEVKRASPSKGDIAPDINAAEQAIVYADAGAAAISVLTEPKWFKGTLSDMEDVRAKVQALGDARPAILRKDFIVDEYQLYEARYYGADTVLLIVAILEPALLSSLLARARELGMEPLVEVNSRAEMDIALQAGAAVIGVNNRNLHSFQVDMSATSRAIAGVDRTQVTLLALSGIKCRLDVQRYSSQGVRGVLVGESLMRSPNPAALVQSLRGHGKGDVLVKICGLKDSEGAVATAYAGADLIGLVFAAKSTRCVKPQDARKIVEAVREATGTRRGRLSDIGGGDTCSVPDHFRTCAQLLRAATSEGPLLVGVFADQSVEEVNAIAEEADLDIIQLSGKEAITIGTGSSGSTSVYNRPVIKALHVGDTTAPQALASLLAAEPTPLPMALLLDTKDPSARGGTGKTFNWDIAARVQEQLWPFFLAGGLRPGNVASAVQQVQPFALDISSGVETDGHKDLGKIHSFIQLAKTSSSS